MSFACPRCGKPFTKNQGLKRHLANKTPCIGIDAPQTSPLQCPYCKKPLSRQDSLQRHFKICTIALKNIEFSELNGQETDSRYTLLQARIIELEAQLANSVPNTQLATSTINTGTITGDVHYNTVNNTVNVVHIHPWDGPRCIDIVPKMIIDAFAQNERLHEYMQMGEHERANHLSAPPYVIELLMGLVKLAHAEPIGRNIYLSPNRSDQTLVLKKDGGWELISLSEATRILFDDVISWTKLSMLTDEILKSLPINAQSALACAKMHYEYEPEKYVQRAKAPMAAHLANCRNKMPKPDTKIVIEESTLKPPPRNLDQIIPLGPALLRSSYDPPVAYIPRYPDPTAKPCLNDERAAKLFMNLRPTEPITVEYIKNLARTAGEDVDCTIKKLWEAVEEGCLTGELAEEAKKVIAKYDADRDIYYR
jgi:hypothetical protein